MGMVDFLASEWKWIGTTAIAVYGATLATLTKLNNDRKERHDVHIVLQPIQNVDDPQALQEYDVILTNRGLRRITITSIGFEVDIPEAAQERTGIGQMRISMRRLRDIDEAGELPITLEPDSAPVRRSYVSGPADFPLRRLAVEDSHGRIWEVPTPTPSDLDSYQRLNDELDRLMGLGDRPQLSLETGKSTLVNGQHRSDSPYETSS